MKRVSRITVFLCLMLALNEFGPAQLMRLESPVNNQLTKKSNKSYFKEEEEVDNDDCDAGEYDQVNAVERSAGSIATKFFKVVKFGSEFFPKVTTLAGMISTIYLLIEQCCGGKWKMTCTWNNEVESIRQELDSKGIEIEKMELNIKNLQESLIAAKRDFNDIVRKMNDIGKASGRLLKSLDPEMEIALNKTSNKLAMMMKEKQEVGEKVKYIELEKEFFGVMDGILGIAVPMFTTVIPSIPKLIKWAKARMGRYKSYELDHSVDAKAIEPPDITDAKYKSSKSWFGKQLGKIAFEVDNAEYQLKTKYKRAYNVFEKVKKYFGIVSGYAGAAFSIYSTVTKFQKCDTAYAEAEKAVKEMRKAKEKMDEIYNATVAARDRMNEARDILKGNLTGEIFLNDLSELKKNLDLIKRDGIDENFSNILKAMDRYITEAPNSRDGTFKETERLLRMLYENLYQLPSYYDCYTNKVSVVSTVLRRCQEGDQSLSRLNADAKTLTDLNWQSCETKIGMKQISDETLEKIIEEQSVKRNFNKICELNSADRNATVCLKMCVPKNSFKKTQIALDLDISVKVVDIITKDCELCENAINSICLMRDFGQSFEEIHEKRYPHYKLKQIKAVDCSKFEDQMRGTQDSEENE